MMSNLNSGEEAMVSQFRIPGHINYADIGTKISQKKQVISLDYYLLTLL